MDRLTAIDVKLAAYVRDYDAPIKPLDPFKYLNALLSIRSAKGLISFLDDYPNGLLSTFASYDPEQEEVNTPAPTGSLAFGESAISNAAIAYGIDYIDGMANLKGIKSFDDTLTEWGERLQRINFAEVWTEENAHDFYSWFANMPKTELYCTELAALEDLITTIESILRLAAVSHGLCKETTGLFTPHKTQDKMSTYVVIVNEEKLGDLLPMRETSRRIGSDLYKRCNSGALPRLERFESGEVYIQAHSTMEDRAIRDAAGSVVAFVLSEWIRWYNRKDPVRFTLEEGYKVNSIKNNDIIIELCDIVAKQRFGICPICGRPFVVKRRPIKGVINKTFCTNSCKVKGHYERRSNAE